MSDPNEFRCLHCGEPVEDRYWCDDCRLEALPPDGER